MKVAIVHDFLNQSGGAEKVLEIFHEIFPQAPVFTLIYNKKKLPQYKDWDIRTSFIDKLPFAKTNHYYYLCLYPKAIESFGLQDYDLVLSSCNAWSKGVNSRGLHICYCYSPARFIYFNKDDFLKPYNIFLRAIIKVLLKYIKKWDLFAAEKPGYYLTSSFFVQERIKRIYNRESEIIPPAVNTDFFMPSKDRKTDDFYLIVSRLKEYKSLDIAIAAFNKIGYPLKIAGEGRELSRLKLKAKSNIEFLGFVNQYALLKLYQGCKALIVPGTEDFGLASLEAQACGRPVIASAVGGTKESIIIGETGILFDGLTPDSLIDSIMELNKMNFDIQRVRLNALTFDKGIFKKKLSDFIFGKYRIFSG